jgi:hypothetical protein
MQYPKSQGGEEKGENKKAPTFVGAFLWRA